MRVARADVTGATGATDQNLEAILSRETTTRGTAVLTRDANDGAAEPGERVDYVHLWLF